MQGATPGGQVGSPPPHLHNINIFLLLLHPDRCGRPLGLAFTKSGELLVCDAIHGLYMLHLEEEVVRRTMLLPIHLEIQGKQHKVYNSIAISQDDQTDYLTISSTRFGLLLLLLLLLLLSLLRLPFFLSLLFLGP